MNSKESELLVCAKTKIPCINNGARDFALIMVQGIFALPKYLFIR